MAITVTYPHFIHSFVLSPDLMSLPGHELSTLSVQEHNSLTAHDNLLGLKFDNFCEFQNVISD